MNRIIRLDHTAPQLRVRLSYACQVAKVTTVTLLLRRAGAWPQFRREFVTEMTECGPMRVPVDVDITPPWFTFTSHTITGQWDALFDLTDEWLAEPDGRYDGHLVTSCGNVAVRVQKGAPVRPRAAPPPLEPCGDADATCPPLPAGPPLSLPPPPPPPPPPDPCIQPWLDVEVLDNWVNNAGYPDAFTGFDAGTRAIASNGGMLFAISRAGVGTHNTAVSYDAGATWEFSQTPHVYDATMPAPYQANVPAGRSGGGSNILWVDDRFVFVGTSVGPAPGYTRRHHAVWWANGVVGSAPVHEGRYPQGWVHNLVRVGNVLAILEHQRTYDPAELVRSWWSADKGQTWNGPFEIPGSGALTVYTSASSGAVGVALSTLPMGAGPDRRVLRTTDGVTWTVLPDALPEATTLWNDVVWTGEVFLALNQLNGAGLSARSADGVTWTAHPMTSACAECNGPEITTFGGWGSSTDLATDGAGAVDAGGGNIGFWRSTDHGLTWSLQVTDPYVPSAGGTQYVVHHAGQALAVGFPTYVRRLTPTTAPCPPPPQTAEHSTAARLGARAGNTVPLDAYCADSILHLRLNGSVIDVSPVNRSAAAATGISFLTGQGVHEDTATADTGAPTTAMDKILVYDSSLDFKSEGPYTIEFWVKRTHTAWQANYWCSAGATHYFSIGSDGLLFVSGWMTGDTPLTLDTWHHVAVTRDADGMSRLWKDGVAQGAAQYGNSHLQTGAKAFGVFGVPGRADLGRLTAGVALIDEIRFTRAVRYTDAFTVPTPPLPDCAPPPPPPPPGPTLLSSLRMESLPVVDDVAGNTVNVPVAGTVALVASPSAAGTALEVSAGGFGRNVWGAADAPVFTDGLTLRAWIRPPPWAGAGWGSQTLEFWTYGAGFERFLQFSVFIYDTGSPVLEFYFETYANETYAGMPATFTMAWPHTGLTEVAVVVSLNAVALVVAGVTVHTFNFDPAALPLDLSWGGPLSDSVLRIAAQVPPGQTAIFDEVTLWNTANPPT